MAAALGLAVVPAPRDLLRAQESRGGLQVSLGVSTGLEYEDDDGGETSLNNRLTFGLSSATRSQRLDFNFTGLYELADPEVTDPFRPSANGSYEYETRSLSFGLDASIRQRDVDSVFLDPEFVGEFFDSDDLIEDSGTRRDVSFGARLETGRDAPFGTVTTWQLRDRSYSGTTDPDLTDRRSETLSSVLRFSLTPTFDARLIASRSDVDEDDAEETERERTRFAVGVDTALDRAWSLSAEIGRTEVVTVSTPVTPGPRVEEVEDGLDAAVALERDLPNGTLGFSIGRTFNQNGSRDTVLVSRAMDLPGGATLSGSVGATSFETGSTRALISLAYARPLPNGGFEITLTQEGDVSDDESNLVRTTAGASYDYEIDPVSTLSFSGRLAAVDVLSGPDEDTTRVELGVAYTRALTEDWGLTAGLRHRVTYTDGDRGDGVNTLSLNLSRTFDWRP